MQQKYLTIIRGSSNYALSNNSTFSQVETGSMAQLLCTYVLYSTFHILQRKTCSSRRALDQLATNPPQWTDETFVLYKLLLLMWRH